MCTYFANKPGSKNDNYVIPVNSYYLYMFYNKRCEVSNGKFNPVGFQLGLTARI